MRVAITGGIGSGKSTVAQIIESRGYKVFSCDKIYNDLLSDRGFVISLASEFGDILDLNGNLDRKKLSALVFSDKEKLKTLNSITHPKIIKQALKLTDCKDISFCEVPLLFENGFEKLFDSIIVVLRDFDKRINAVSERDNLERNSVIERANSQLNYELNDFKEYYVIHNDGNFEQLSAKTVEILSNLINKKF